MPKDQVGKKQGSRSKRTRECKKLQRIRARSSYRLFKELHDFLRGKPGPADVLRKVHDILDARWSFGSERNAACAEESLDLVLADNGELFPGSEQSNEDDAKTTAKVREDASEKCLGNFVLGECFADIKCRHGHKTRLFNIGRGHFVACDECRTYIHVGSTLMSNWRQENQAVWERNSDSVEGYELIEWA